MRKFVCILCFIGFIYSVSAQIDSSYIRPYEQKMMLMGYVVKEFVFLNVETPELKEMYMPNNPVELGVGVSLKNTIISIAGGYGFDFMRDKTLGKTSSFDLQLHNYTRKFVLDLFIQYYKGFYKEMEKQKDVYTLHPDLKVSQYGVNGQYIFNHRRFSYKGAFNQSEKQLRNAGSFLAGAGIYLTNIQSDSTFVYNERRNLDNVQIVLNGGYAHTWVFGDHWHLTAAVTAGIGFGNESVKRIGKDRLEIYPTVMPRMAAAYNKDHWGLCFTFVANMTFPNFSDDQSLSLFAGNFLLTYIHRLDEVPLLSKFIK